jgi:fatty acid-binding protein DegV
VFIVGAIEFAQRGGRLAAGVADDARLPVLALTAGRMKSFAQVHDVDEAMDAMTAELVRLASGTPQRVGVGHALVPELARAFADRLRTHAEVADLVFYDVGPSVGAHTGPGTLGACFFPTH